MSIPRVHEKAIFDSITQKVIMRIPAEYWDNPHALRRISILVRRRIQQLKMEKYHPNQPVSEIS